jgi:cytoskeleton protein RodZ
MVENFGVYLKNERELRGVALEEIAESTKIHIRFLEALENNEFDKLPGEVFVKGFIRSYARIIGFDSEEMVNVYDESVGRDRKEELGKVEISNEKVQSQKKATTGYLFGGIALASILSLGYFVVDNLIDKNKKQQVERLSAGKPLTQPDQPPFPLEANLPDNTEIDNAVNQIEEPLTENLQKASTSIDTETRSESTAENPPPPAPTDSTSEISRREANKQEVRGSEPAPSLQPSEPQEDKKEDPKTPIESAIMEKHSTLSEKPVIIQQVMESLTPSASPDQGMSESDVKPLHLKIQVQGNSWFNVTVDDSKEEDFILPGGSSKNVYGREKIQLTIGNRNGTQLFLNEQPIDLPPGSSDVIRNFDITANLLE